MKKEVILYLKRHLNMSKMLENINDEDCISDMIVLLSYSLIVSEIQFTFKNGCFIINQHELNSLWIILHDILDKFMGGTLDDDEFLDLILDSKKITIALK